MILLPLRHENMNVRRWPWVTFTLMALCIVVHLAGLTAGGAGDGGAGALQDVLRYWLEHPYLELPADVATFADRAIGASKVEALHAAVPPARSEEEQAARVQEQRELDGLVQAFRDVRRDAPAAKWGLVPNALSPVALLTHMFLHGGWLHLLGNLFFLYLVGPFIEDAWGRPLFLAFYLGAGCVAALGFALRYPQLDTPMIGASGAIAGVMGAFLVRYWSTRIQFFYWIGLWWRGTFWAPAWAMLSLWLLQQVFWALLMDGFSASGGGGVAYWAHVFGFAFGVAAAYAVRRFRVEERWIAPRIEQLTTTKVPGTEVIEQAYALRAAGRMPEALQLLRDECARTPGNPHVGLVLWVFAVEADCAADAAPVMVDVIRRELREGEHDLAVQHWLELAEAVPQAQADAATMLRLVALLAEHEHRESAAFALRGAMIAAGAAMPGAVALRIAALGRTLDPRVAAAAARLALARADLSPLEREQAERLAEECATGPVR